MGILLARAVFDIGAHDILNMSPYRAQVALVKKLWTERFPDSERGPRVQTVDASQGSEATIVIVLTSRNGGLAGFLRSIKRSNVMLSRARVAQYVIGDYRCLTGKEFRGDGGKLQKYLLEANVVLGKDVQYVVYPTTGKQ